jgi:hypothetical protein
MVPLDGEEDIGEVACGLRDGNYPVWKTATFKGPEAGPGWNKSEQPCLSIHESQEVFRTFPFQQTQG